MDEQDNPQANSGGQSPRTDDAALRELALALIAPRNVDAALDDGRQLLPGQLPPDFASDFPLPPGARVVGSLVALSPVIVLDTEQAGEDVVAFYQEQLTAAGWSTEDQMRSRHGGFLHAGMVDRQYRSLLSRGWPIADCDDLCYARRAHRRSSDADARWRSRDGDARNAWPPDARRYVANPATDCAAAPFRAVPGGRQRWR